MTWQLVASVKTTDELIEFLERKAQDMRAGIAKASANSRTAGGFVSARKGRKGTSTC